MISLLPPVHIAIVPADRILTGLDELYTLIPRPADRTSSMVFITGPSRTADIEQILVRGVHGPGRDPCCDSGCRCACLLALMLFAAALGTAQVRIYVANGGDSRVTVIDPETNKVTGEIAVSPNPFGLAASPEGHWLYVTSRTKGVLDAVDLKDR